MTKYTFEPWHFYKIDCLVPMAKIKGRGFERKWKFWFALHSGEKPVGFFINSKKHYNNPLQMDITPKDINCYLPNNASPYHTLKHESVINFRPWTFKNERKIFKAETILNAMPTPLARKIFKFLKANEDHIPDDTIKIMEDELKKYF